MCEQLLLAVLLCEFCVGELVPENADLATLLERIGIKNDTIILLYRDKRATRTVS